MTILSKFTTVSIIVCAFNANIGFASTQSIVASDANIGPSSWASDVVGVIDLAPGTNIISELSGTVTLRDQGWGGQNNDNGVKMWLVVNGVTLLSEYAAGAQHYTTTQSWDWTTGSSQLADFNKVLGSLDYSVPENIQVEMVDTAWGYPGWALYTSNASFSVTSEAIPEPTTIALLAAGLFGLGVSRRKYIQA